MDIFPQAFIISDEKEIKDALSDKLTQKNCKTIDASVNSLNERCDYLFLITQFSDKKISSKDLEAFFNYVQVFKPKTDIILPLGKESEEIEEIRKLASKFRIQIIYLGQIENMDAVINKILRGIFSYGYGALTTTIGNEPWKKEHKEDKGEPTLIRKIQIPEIVPIKIGRQKTRKKLKLKIHAKPIAIFILGFLWLISIPFLLLLISSATLRLCMNRLYSLDFSSANACFEISKNISLLSNKSFLIFDEGKATSATIYNFSKLGKNFSDTLSLGQKISKEAMGASDYDLQGQSDQLYLNLDEINKDSQFLTAEKKYEFLLPKNIELTDISFYLENLKTIAKNLPNILGMSQKTNYAVLLTDQGSVKSFGIFTFDKGKLTDTNFTEAKEADLLLKGQVQAPFAISKYLGKNNFTLSDSNWDPDFRISGEKAMWFINKELGINADGIISMDQKDFEGINNFKGNFLQYLMKSFDLLKAKKAVIYFSGNIYGTELSKLNWNGNVEMPSPTSLGVVETNFGEPNDKIVKSASWNIDFDNTNFTNQATFNLNNTSSQTYKTYVRVLVPNGSHFMGGGFDLTNHDGYVEAGKYLEIKPQTLGKISFNWSVKNTLKDQLLIFMRKQPGTESLPTNISLTHGTIMHYNTNLVDDYSVWQKLN